MQAVSETLLKMMPVWFAIGFLGPVLLEICLRTPLHGYVSINLASEDIYATCMVFGGAYGLIAWRTGRWI